MQFDTHTLQSQRLRSLDLDLSDEVKAYQMALYNNRDRPLEEFNHMIESIIPGILQRTFVTNQGNLIKVKGVEVKFPQSQSDIGNTLMTPFIAKMTGNTYKCDVYIDYVEIKSNGHLVGNENYISNQSLVDDKIKTKKIGSFHCVVGSNRCITSVKPDEFLTLDEWKMFLGECPASPGAYIINKGGQKVVRMDEKLRTNCYLTFMTKGDNPTIETRITCMNNSITSLVRLRIGSHRPCVKVLFPHLKGKHYPLYLTYYLLYYSHNSSETNKVTFKLNYLENLIASFAPTELRDAVISYLKPSKMKFMELFTGFDKNGGQLVNETKIQEYISKKLDEIKTRVKDEDMQKYTLSNAAHNVPNELFNQCSTYSGKLANLAFMSCQTILCAMGLRSFDGRDGWDQKKVDSVVRMITSYVATTLVDAIKSDKPDNIGFNFGKSDRKEAIVETRKYETLNIAIAEINTVDNQVDTRTNSLAVRKVDQTQLFMICFPKTSEGEKCGLTKVIAALTVASFCREYSLGRKQVFDDLFEPNICYFSNTRNNIYKYKLATSNVNGATLFVHYKTETTEYSPDLVFFSKRVLLLFKDLFEQKKAVYYVDDETIWIKFLDLNNQPVNHFFDTYIGGTMVVSIPPTFASTFHVATQFTKNPAYFPYSSIYKTEECKYRIAFRNPDKEFLHSYVIYPNGSHSHLYVSDLFIAGMNSILGPKYPVEIIGEDAIVTFKGEIHQFTCDHWSGNRVTTMIHKVLESRYENLLSTITDMIALKKSLKYSYSLTFNGNVVTFPGSQETFYPTNVWVDGNKLHSYLKEQRRTFNLPYDSCIHLNEKDRAIQYFDDSGRLMAPLLKIDSNGDLIIDKLNGWSKFHERDFADSGALIKELYRNGSMELIDSKEVDQVLVATSLQEARNFSKLRKFLNMIDLKTLKSSVYIEQNGYFKNEDMSVVMINGKTYEIQFTLKEPEFETLKMYQDGNIYYGTYVVEKPQMKKPRQRYYELKKQENAILSSDGKYQLYNYKNNFFIITEDTKHSYDDASVYIGIREYPIKTFTFPRNRETVTINDDLMILDDRLVKKNHVPDDPGFYYIDYYKLVKPSNPILSNGYHMLYLYNGQYRFITRTSDEETDGKNVYIDGQKYKIEYFEFPKDKSEVYVDSHMKVLSLTELERPSVNPSVENSNVYYRCDNRWIDSSELVDKHFIVENGEYKIVTEVYFENGSNFGVFDLLKQKLNEYIPESVTTYQHYDEEKYEKDELDKYECNLHINNIRRCVDELENIDIDELEITGNFFETLSSMKNVIPSFGNKRVLLNVRKYLNSEFKFTHCMIDPNAAFSVIANFVPKADSNPGPRWSYQCSMGTQALGVGNCVWYRAYETTTKRLITPVQHAFETCAELPYSQITMPITQNTIFGNLPHVKGFEDPTVVSEEFIRKIGRHVKEITIKMTETTNREFTETVCQPTDEMGNIKNKPIYRNLDGYGLPKLGTYIREKDCIIGKSKVYTKIGKKIDSSYFAGVGEDGIVSSIQIVSSEGVDGSFRTIYVKLTQVRYQQPGDKMAARYSQKGTIGDIINKMIDDGDVKLKIVDANLMPYVASGPNRGMRLEIIFNPASFPSRMTCGLLKEQVTAKAAVYLQQKVNATNFHHLDMDYYTDSLYENRMLYDEETGVQQHLDANGNEFLCHSDGEIMMDPSTGKPFQCAIGIVAYQILKHQADDKKQVRSIGPVKPITQQPVDGKKNKGGGRMGEMERDAVLSSGAADLLFDRFMEASDGYLDVFCNHCNNNSFMSALDSKTCQICGVSGSLVSVAEPRVYKVLMHQMSAIGLNIKTEFKPADDFQNELYKQNKLLAENEALKHDDVV